MKRRTVLLLTILITALLCGCAEDKHHNAPEGDERTELLPEENTDENAENSSKNDSEAGDESASKETDEEETEAGNPDISEGPYIIHPVFNYLERTQMMPYRYEECIKVKGSGFTLGDDEAMNHPRLAKSLYKSHNSIEETLNATFERDSREINDIVNSEVTKANGERTESGQRMMSEEDIRLKYEEDRYFTLERTERKDMYLIRSDSVVFSFVEDYNGYSGGAHGYFALYGHNFDSESGHELMIEDVVTDMDRLNEILMSELLAKYDYLFVDRVKGVLENSKNGQEGYDYTWVISRDGIMFVFNPYEIECFAAGMHTVTVMFDDYPELFKTKYIQAPEEYVRNFNQELPVFEDIDGDGKKERITANSTIEQAGQFSNPTMKMTVSIDESETEFENTDTFGTRLFFVHTNNGNYIYNFEDLSGGQCLFIYDLKDGKASEREGCIPVGIPLKRETTDDNSFREPVMQENIVSREEIYFTDPSCAYFSSKTDVIGMEEGLAQYVIDENGVPKMIGEVYDVSNEWRFDGNFHVGPRKESRVELKMDEISETGAVTREDVVIPAGTALYYIRTDNKTYADFKIKSDGDYTTYRARIDREQEDGYGATDYICGVNVWDALDNLKEY